jgi:hypothetical protein
MYATCAPCLLVNTHEFGSPLRHGKCITMLMRSKKLTALLLSLGLAGLHAASAKQAAQAEPGDDLDARNRCASRLAITLLGENPSAVLLGNPAPLSEVDAMLKTPQFADRFSSFISSEFNSAPSETPLQDTAYFLSKYVIENDKPWSELFVGRYDMFLTADKMGLTVKDSPTGLGYFRTLSWMQRYAGNEPQGIRLTAAYRMIQNTTGTNIIPTVGAPEDDRSVSGRKGGVCKSCHYDAWYALDKAAAVLSKKVVAANGDISFTPNTTAGEQQLLGKTVKDDRELLEGLVNSNAWKVGQCRFIFKFLFGRTENTCEAPLFDRCVDALSSPAPTLKAAVTAIAKDPGFCQ